jgi:type IV pilus assembly protein PilC
MPVFEYIARDQEGKECSGLYQDVESVGCLRSELSKAGYTLLAANKQKTIDKNKRYRVSTQDIVAFAYEFSGMYSAGLTIVQSFEALQKQSENKNLKMILRDIQASVEAGSSLAMAFEPYEYVFGSFFIGMVEAGELGGKLSVSLRIAAEYLEKQSALKNKIQSAFAYPVMVFIMCILVVTGLVIFIIPVFQKLYSQLKVTLPVPTLILIGASTIIRQYWWIAIPTVAALVYITIILYRLKRVQLALDNFLLVMPVFGKLYRMVLVCRFVRTLAMMNAAGVPIVESIQMSIRICKNSVMKTIGANILARVMEGSTLTEMLAANSIFPPIIVQLAAAGEQAGILSEMLNKGGDYLDGRIESHLKSLLVKIEPITSLFLGLVVGTILLGVYLPMFDFMGHVK